MKIRSIQGMHDILPGSVELWQRIEAATRSLFRLYGYAEVRTPLLEEQELFSRSIGQETDIVQKEMYTLAGHRGKAITLRPEGTASVVRAYIEHRLDREQLLSKLYYIGPMFRRERPQKGRYRQFHQLGAEVLGLNNPAIEAEVIEMLTHLLEELGVEDVRLLVNSVGCPECRPDYVQKLREALRENASFLCSECLRRMETNTLRVLDCKVPSCQPIIDRLPSIQDHLCQTCVEHFTHFIGYLDLASISYEIAPRLVRGLDYYVRTTFEIISDRLGPTQNALLGGGRYDGLSELLDGPPTQGFGFALGIERLVLLLSSQEDLEATYVPPEPELFLAYLNKATLGAVLPLARQLRQDGVFVYVDFGERSLKAQMRLANRLQALFVCVVGEEEMGSGEFSLKRMSDGLQQKVSRDAIADYVRQGI